MNVLKYFAIKSTNQTSLFRGMLIAMILASALNLTGCANQAKLKADQQTRSSQATNSIAETQNSLTSEFIYQYLVAEIAGQRGDFATSGSIFYQLAKSESDPRFAERAAKTAVYGNVGNLVFPAVELWAQLDPTSIEAQQAMTEILIKSGKLSEAKPYLSQLLAKEDTRAASFLFINSLLNKNADKEAVLALTKSLAEPYPRLAEAHFSIAQAALTANQNALALSELDIAESIRPDWNLAALLKGQLLFLQLPASAIQYYQAFLNKNPKSNEVRLNLAKILVSEKQYSLAKKEFPIILNQVKADIATSGNKKNTNTNNLADVTTVIGLLSYQAGDYDNAKKYFEQALDLNFKDPDQIYVYLGQNAEKQQQEMIAKNWYEKVGQGQFYLEAQFNIANLVARHSVDDAIKYLDQIENLTTEQQLLVIQTEASMYAKAKRNQESFDLLDKAVKNMPNTPELVYDYALAAERVQKFDVMESELRKTITAKPDFAAAYNALGYSFADRNIKLDEAIELIKKALTLSPNDHYMLDSLGWAYYRKGDLEQAAQYLQQAFKINSDPEIAAHLGEVLWKKGQYEEAKKIWNDALITSPDNEVLQSTALKFKS